MLTKIVSYYTLIVGHLTQTFGYNDQKFNYNDPNFISYPLKSCLYSLIELFFCPNKQYFNSNLRPIFKNLTSILMLFCQIT